LDPDIKIPLKPVIVSPKSIASSSHNVSVPPPQHIGGRRQQGLMVQGGVVEPREDDSSLSKEIHNALKRIEKLVDPVHFENAKGHIRLSEDHLNDSLSHVHRAFDEIHVSQEGLSREDTLIVRDANRSLRDLMLWCSFARAKGVDSLSSLYRIFNGVSSSEQLTAQLKNGLRATIENLASVAKSMSLVHSARSPSRRSAIKGRSSAHLQHQAPEGGGVRFVQTSMTPPGLITGMHFVQTSMTPPGLFPGMHSMPSSSTHPGFLPLNDPVFLRPISRLDDRSHSAVRRYDSP